MADVKIERALVPIAVVAAVLGIWVALRKPSVVPTAFQQPAAPSDIPPLPALQTTEYAPIPLGPGQRFDSGPVAPGESVGTNPAYVTSAIDAPLAPSPARGEYFSLPPDSYMTFNVPWWLDYQKFAAGTMGRQAAAAGNGKKGGCGCGGGGCSQQAACDQYVNPKIPDGHGECLTARINPNLPDNSVGRAIRENVRYWAAVGPNDRMADVPYTYSPAAAMTSPNPLDGSFQ